MKVVVNSLGPPGANGVTTYVRNVLEAVSDEHEYLVLVPAELELDSTRIARRENIDLRRVNVPFDSLILRLVIEQVVVPFLLWAWEADVLYSPTGDYSTVLSPCPDVFVVHNMAPYWRAGGHRVEFSIERRIKYSVLRTLTRISSRYAAKVIHVSESAKSVIQPHLDTDDGDARVIHHGVDSDRFPDSRDPPTAVANLVDRHSPYVLTVATIDPLKNQMAVVEALARLSPDLRSELSVLFVGRIGDESYRESLEERARTLGIDDRVHIVGPVVEGLGFLYTNAEAFVLPSKLETFGLTPLEAMACETPTVIADATALPEITGDASLRFDPDDPEVLAEALTKAVEDDGTRARLTAAGRERAHEFSWKRTAKETEDVLESTQR